jgi:hypothetical protein
MRQRAGTILRTATSRTSIALTDLCRRPWELPRAVVLEREPGRADSAVVVVVAAVAAVVVVAVVVLVALAAAETADLGS